MRYFLSLIITTLFSYSYTYGTESNGDFIISNFSTNEGLAHKTVTSMIQGKDGFVWIGTTNGLSRFDGYSFRNFFHDNSDSTSLRGTSVWSIAEGLDGKIWLSTDAGLEYFDKEKEAFYLVTIPECKDLDFSKNLCVDKKGYVWVYNSKTDFIAINPKDNTIAFSGLRIPKVFFDGYDIRMYAFTVIDDVIWISSDKGIFKYYYVNGDIQFIYKANLNYCSSLQKTNESTLILSFLLDGIYIINTKTNSGKWLQKKEFLTHSKDKALLNYSTYTSDGILWVGTTNGIISYKNKTDLLNEHNFLLQGEVVSCMISDNHDNILVGTYNKGFYVVKQNKYHFKTFSNLYKDDENNPIVTSIQAFSNGSILFTNNNDFYYCENYKNLNKGSIQKIANTSTSMTFPFSSNACFANNVDSLFKFDSHTKKMTKKIISPATNCAYEDVYGNLWLGSWHGILYGFDSNNTLKYTILIDKHKNRPIYSITGDSNGSLWIGTFGSGLVNIPNPRIKNPTIIKYIYTPGKNSLSNNMIISLYNDNAGIIWIGTCGGGLNKFTIATKQFEVFTIKNGLKSNVIESITSDKSGNIWIASNVLSKYNITHKTFTHYTQSDGITGNFLVNSVSQTNNGNLLFGTSNGILLVNTNSLKHDNKFSTPLITGLRIRGLLVKAGQLIEDKIPYTTSITYTNVLNIPYEFNTFAIEFASIHLSESHNIVYEYKLEGIDKSWIPAETKNRIASYSALQPGKYVFKVRAGNGNNIWSEPKIITINIIPPWWKTIWFRILIILVVIGCITFVLINRTRNLKKRNEKLENLVFDRTIEIEKTNKLLQESAQKLEYKNRTLEENQIVIEMKNKDLIDALTTKDKLISIIGHDFKNPLTGLQGSAILLKEESKKINSEKISKFADTIIATSTSLMNQMLLLLDWAQCQISNMHYNPSEINLGILIRDSIELISENAQQKNIKISTHFEYKTNALVDARMISTVFRNLLMNAIKFTPRGGKIMVMIQEYENGINITFVDTGIGMSIEKQDAFKLENEFIESSFGTENEKGTGLGLQISKSFVKKNNGTITLQCIEGEGSVFTITLPKGLTEVIQHELYNKESDVLNEADNSSILIIDDDSSVIEYLQNTFEELYQVSIAKDGKEGIYIAKNIIPDVIISDINLPGLEGTALCEELKNNELTKHIPIILITSNSDNEIQNKSYLCGADDFITKPLNIFVLKQKIRILLETRKTINEKAKKQFNSEKKFILPEDFESKIIKKTVAFIHENISNPDLDTNTIADNIGVSRSQLWRIFTKSMGKSLGDIIKDIRMQKAMEMIKTGKYRINEVTYEVGYSDAKYFARCFAKEFGKSPSSFIKNNE